jgi:hypothetical protein
LLNGELYRLGILIAVVVLTAALALVAGHRRLSGSTGSNLMPTLAGWRSGVPTPRRSSPRRPQSHRGPKAHQRKQPSRRHPSGKPTRLPHDPACTGLGTSLALADASWRQRVGREIASCLSTGVSSAWSAGCYSRSCLEPSRGRRWIMNCRTRAG